MGEGVRTMTAIIIYVKPSKTGVRLQLVSSCTYDSALFI